MGSLFKSSMSCKIDELREKGYLAYCIIFLVFHSLAGIGVLAVSIWMYIDTKAYLAGETNEKIFISIYILMGAGSLMTLIGFLGCCGAMQESSCLLGTFSTLVVLVFAAEIAGAVYAWKNQDEVKEAFTKRLEEMVTNEFGVQEGVTFALNAMQEKLECCGANGESDWKGSAFSRNSSRGFVGDMLLSRVPLSCCDTSIKINPCTYRSSDNPSQTLNIPLDKAYSKGCIEKLKEKIEQHINIILAVGLGVAAVQILGFILSLVLCCAVSRSDAY